MASVYRQYGTSRDIAINLEQLDLIKADLHNKNLTYACEFLHLAVSYGKVEVARLLLSQYNCPIDCKNNNGQTPLHIACSKGHLSMVKMLVTEYKAKLTLHEINKVADCGQTETVGFLICEFNCNPGIKGGTLLHLACRQGHDDLVEALLTRYSRVADLLSTDRDGNIPLHDAAWAGSESIVRSIIAKYKCPVDSRNHSKQTPLHFACTNGHLKTVEMLVSDFRADLNACDENNDTPLHKAAQFGQSELLLSIIKSKFYYNPYVKGSDGKTTLHYACLQGHAELTEALLAKGGPDLLSISDACGNTPLHFAASSGNLETVRLLIIQYKYCPLNCENNSRETPLDIACNEGHHGLLELILNEHKAGWIHNISHIAAWHGESVVMNSFIEKLDNDLSIKNIYHKNNDCVPNGRKYYIGDLAPLSAAQSSENSDDSSSVQPLVPLILHSKAALIYSKYDIMKKPAAVSLECLLLMNLVLMKKTIVCMHRYMRESGMEVQNVLTAQSKNSIAYQLLVQ